GNRRRPLPRPWPPPPAVQSVLLDAQGRYGKPSPNLRCPSSAVGLFTAGDLLTLAQWNYWPLPRRVVAWLACGDDRFDRHLSREQVVAIVRDTLAADLPDALTYLLKEKS